MCIRQIKENWRPKIKNSWLWKKFERANKPVAGRERVILCASSSLVSYLLHCVPVQERKLRGHGLQRSSKFQPVCASVFSVSRCLAEPCVSIDLAGCKRTVADGRDQNRNLTCWIQTLSLFSLSLSFCVCLFIFVHFLTLTLPLALSSYFSGFFTHIHAANSFLLKWLSLISTELHLIHPTLNSYQLYSMKLFWHVLIRKDVKTVTHNAIFSKSNLVTTL